MCAVEAGKPCPVGVEVCGRVEEALSGVNDFFWHADFDGPRGVEAGGTFLGRVVDILEETRQWHEPKAAQNSSFPPPRLSVYGAHDTTIASLLGAMMVPKFGGPEFVAHITWELWGPPTLSSMAVPSDGWVVHIRHQNEPLLGVLGCKSGTCSLEAFMDAMVPSRVRRKEDCQPRDEDG